MEITAIDRAQSTAKRILVSTNPPIKHALFDHIHRLAKGTPSFEGTTFTLQGASLLIEAPQFTQKLSQDIKDLLNHAEKAEQDAKHNAEMSEALAEKEKYEAVSAIGKMFG